MAVGKSQVREPDLGGRRRASLQGPEWQKSKEESNMAKEKDFAEELNGLITRYLEMGCDPQEIIDELTREANSVFGHYNLEIYLEAKCCKDADRS
jgi:hypothetical protein